MLFLPRYWSRRSFGIAHQPRFEPVIGETCRWRAAFCYCHKSQAGYSVGIGAGAFCAQSCLLAVFRSLFEILFFSTIQREKWRYANVLDWRDAQLCPNPSPPRFFSLNRGELGNLLAVLAGQSRISLQFCGFGSILALWVSGKHVWVCREAFPENRDAKAGAARGFAPVVSGGWAIDVWSGAKTISSPMSRAIS